MTHHLDLPTRLALTVLAMAAYALITHVVSAEVLAQQRFTVPVVEVLTVFNHVVTAMSAMVGGYFTYTELPSRAD
jgi:hypothetical protein